MNDERQKHLPLRPPRGRLSPARAAMIAGVSDRTILNWIEEGLVKASRYNPKGWWDVDYDSLMRLVNSANQST